MLKRLAIAVITALSLVAAITAPVTDSLGSAPRTTSVNGRIAFEVRDRSGRPEIWTMNQDGSDLRLFTSGRAPTWSSDGTQLVVVSPDNEIVLLRPDGSGERVVDVVDPMRRQDPILTAALSPDGKTIAFGTLVGLYVVPAEGGEARTLVSRAGATRIPDFAARPSWSPDGSRIAFLGQGGRLSVVGADGSGLTTLTGAQGAVGGQVSWSPDGSKIAYGGIVPRTSVGGRLRLSVARLDGRAPSVLIPYNGLSASDPAWSPDGTRIAFVGEGTDICVANADGTGLGRLTYTPPGNNSHPAWQQRPAGSPPAGAPAAPSGPPPSWDRNRSWAWACMQAAQGLALTGHVDLTRVKPGDVVTYRLRLANRGGVPIGAIGFAGFYAELDGDARVLSVVAGRGRCDTDPLEWIGRPAVGIECQFGSLFPGEHVDVRVRARAKTPGEVRLEGFLIRQVGDGRRLTSALSKRTHVGGCTIRGTPRADALSGSRHADVICGLDGGDRIRPGAGRDRVYAGPDADVVLVRDSQRDVVSCGSGVDAVTADEMDRVASDCERAGRR